MPASESTVFQVNLKTAKGALINVYARDDADLSVRLQQLESMVGQVAAVEAALEAASAAGGILAPAAMQAQPVQQQQPQYQQPAQQQPPWAQPQQAPQQQHSAAPQCQHGPRVHRSGVSKTGKPYDAWFCSSQDRNAQCAPEWSR